MSAATTTPEELTFDLVVIGGGLAGLCAAVAAARHGTRVALVQERSVFGGNCSSEVRVVPHGGNHSNSWAGETGLPLALILEDRVTNHEAFPDHGMINAHWDFTLLEAARREPNLTYFLNTVVDAVDSEGDDAPGRPTSNGLGRIGGGERRIRAVHALQLGSERRFRFVAPQFIDATGDGTVGFLAGADFRYGREARDEFGEPLAPLVADDVTMGATITMRARDIGRATPYLAPPWIERYTTKESIGFKRTLYHLTKPVYGGYWWLEVCNPFHQIDDNAAVREELHRHVLGVWNFIKNHSDQKERASTYVLDWMGMVPGKRESRRLVGDVTLTEQDCHETKHWPDAVGLAGWWIDLHIKGGILNKVDPGERENADKNYKHWIRVPSFTVPLRCFYSRNVGNLWMAGRSLSTTHVALGPVRVMQTLAMLGQSVGTAAAYAVAGGLTPRETAAPDGPHIGAVQQLLLRDDVRIPTAVNRDARDVARGAAAAASSDAELDLSRVHDNMWYRLGPVSDVRAASPGLAMVVPLTTERLDRAELYLRNESSEPRRVRVALQPLERIWDRKADQPVIVETEIELPAGASGWFAAHLDAAIDPGRPHRLSLEGADDVSWAECADWPVGTTMQYRHDSPGGPEPKNAHLGAYAEDEVRIPAYTHWRQLRAALATRLDPPQRPFGGENAVDGKAWVEDMPHCWVSDPARPLPQHLDIRFDRARTIGEVQLSFDTNLARPNQSEPAFFRAPECVRDWRLLAETAEGWREVHAETGNFQRLRRVAIAPVVCTALRVMVDATNGAPEARVFEVRAYEAD